MVRVMAMAMAKGRIVVLQIIMVIVVIIIKLVKVIQIDRQEVIKLELLLFQMFPIQDFM